MFALQLKPTRKTVGKFGDFVQCDQWGQDLKYLISGSFNLIIIDPH